MSQSTEVADKLSFVVDVAGIEDRRQGDRYVTRCRLAF
jgi:hypothetical protein